MVCRTGWTVYNGESCYLLMNTTLSWPQANNFCINQNSSLIQFKDLAKLTYFDSFKRTYYIWVCFFNLVIFFIVWIKKIYKKKKIGAFAKVPYVFNWIDGTSVNPKFYMSGTPNNGGGTPTLIGQGCLILQYYGAFFDDLACAVSCRFICEIIY